MGKQSSERVTLLIAQLFVIESHSEALLERDSSFKLGILKHVNSVGSSQSNRRSELGSLLNKCGDLIHGLGKVTNFEHKIAIGPKLQPVSQHFSRILLSQVEAVNNELDKMLEVDITEEVKETSPWVSNLVVVPKIRGCKIVL